MRAKRDSGRAMQGFVRINTVISYDDGYQIQQLALFLVTAGPDVVVDQQGPSDFILVGFLSSFFETTFPFPRH